MASFEFNFAEPTASYNDSVGAFKDTPFKNAGSIQKSDFVVLNGRPVQIVEVVRSKPGKVGRPKAHLTGVDIFTDKRYELVFLAVDQIEVLHFTKKDYLVADITYDNIVTLFTEEPYEFYNEIKLNKDSNITGPLVDKFKENVGQIMVTVLKALDEEKIIAFKVIE